ncbi:MAG: hypothetical protein N2Z22_05415 [Turneriella sp.]|nr:hypothetical protein [Leptospiraceae bacterium]MCX7632754.1 hypothetical protein [Turneriella sp.]
MRWVLAAWCFVAFFACTTKTQQRAPDKETNTAELNKAEREKFAADLKSKYPPYHRLQVAFTLKGKVSDQELYYEGSLDASAQSLAIRLSDAIFLSPLLTLSMEEKEVKLKDHARNRTEVVPRAQYQWVELFGRAYPVRFFEPLLRGQIPNEILAPGVVLQRNPAGEIFARLDSEAYSAALFFREAVLWKIFYHNRISGEILVFELSNFFRQRSFPQRLRIEHTQSHDYLELNFRNLRTS